MIRFYKIIVYFQVLLLPILGTGKDLKVCDQCQYQSIKSAIQSSMSGDQIIVAQGIYAEGNIKIDKSIALIGEDFPVLDGGDSSQVLTISSSGVTVSGFHIKDVGVSFIEDRAGIKVVTSRNVTIENNFLDNTFFGIYLSHSRNCIIRNNKIIGQAVQEANSGNAIHLWYCDSVLIENNNVQHHRDGIYFEFVNHSKIIHNVSHNNVRYGLHFMFSDHNDYIDNTFERNGAGVAVMYSKYINMEKNQFRNNWGDIAHGLLLKDITDGKIINNVFYTNTMGIYAEGTNRMEIRGNDFIKNGWALKILGNCEGNVVAKNNFMSNTFEVTTNTKSNNNLFKMNYWSGYTGYDLDKDGIGDVPYRPVKLYAYMVEEIPSSIILLRSLFVDLLNLAEKVTPVLTPETLVDKQPLMHKL